tara:strand:- start:4664 stop:5098 length:435 start_codon:yes stop_codon:yes gene_type:complete
MSDSLNQCLTRTVFKIRYSETDQMGVANHARYFDWFSEGRVAWLEQRGQRYADWEQEGWLLPVIEAQCKYFKSIRFQETIEMIIQVAKFNSRKVSFNYEIFKLGEINPVAAATTTHVFLHNGKVRRLKPIYYEVFNRAQEKLNQ